MSWFGGEAKTLTKIWTSNPASKRVMIFRCSDATSKLVSDEVHNYVFDVNTTLLLRLAPKTRLDVAPERRHNQN